MSAKRACAGNSGDANVPAHSPVFAVDDTLRKQFEFERDSALRLKSASPGERPALYQRIYGDYYAQFGEHDGVPNPAHQIQFLGRFLAPDATLVEIGPGGCDTLIAAAKSCREAIGIEAASQPTERHALPSNVRILQANGTEWPLADASADVVYSNQVLEHLHAEDCAAILKTAYRVLKPGGRFVAVTPHRLSGPHDISRDFSDTACGLHLIEYDNAMLARMLRDAGFANVMSFVGARGVFLRAPVALLALLERALAALPKSVRRSAPARAVLGLRIAAQK